MNVTAAQLKKLFPTAKPALLDAVVQGWPLAVQAGITTSRRIRHFLANIGVETGGLRAIVENLNYTTAARIRATWPTRFATDADAVPYVRQPKKLAIKVYGGRMGNAPAPSEDGWRFRGRSMLQTTGREGYAAMGFEDDPDALGDPETAFRIAVREWTRRGLNAIADRDDTTGVRRGINGGTNGLAQVRVYLEKGLTIWPDMSQPATRIYTDEVMVKAVQTRLRDLGYTEVGNPDGKIGRFTRTAILAFREDAGLTLEPVIDDLFLNALASAPHRTVAPERQEAAPKEVRQHAPEVNSNFITKIISMVTGFFAAIGALVKGISDYFSDAQAYVDPIMGYLTSIPSWVFLLLVAAIALTLFLVSRKGEQAGVTAYQTGARR